MIGVEAAHGLLSRKLLLKPIQPAFNLFKTGAHLALLAGENLNDASAAFIALSGEERERFFEQVERLACERSPVTWPARRKRILVPTQAQCCRETPCQLRSPPAGDGARGPAGAAGQERPLWSGRMVRQGARVDRGELY